MKVLAATEEANPARTAAAVAVLTIVIILEEKSEDEECLKSWRADGEKLRHPSAYLYTPTSPAYPTTARTHISTINNPKKKNLVQPMTRFQRSSTVHSPHRTLRSLSVVMISVTRLTGRPIFYSLCLLRGLMGQLPRTQLPPAQNRSTRNAQLGKAMDVIWDPTGLETLIRLNPYQVMGGGMR